MEHDLTHASFFSGIGGTDLGLERAGWRTVSLSEIDPYANAVLAEHWPAIPNLGDITTLDAETIPNATLWSGGFPCQDLSLAGKRQGLAGKHSGLAITFLDLVSRRKPRWILLENVPGLLSSHRGKDLGTLLGTLGELGYWWSYRILDAWYFGVPQRRRRIYIVASLGTDSAIEVLRDDEGGHRHPAARAAQRPHPARDPIPGIDYARTVVATMHKHHDEDADTIIPESAAPHAIRVRAAARLSRWMDDDPRLPKTIEEDRYRALGNAVCVPVAEWIGRRLRDVIEHDTQPVAPQS